MLFNETYNKVNSFSPFSLESKQMIHEVGNIKFVWIARDGTQNAMQSMLIITGTSASSIALDLLSTQFPYKERATPRVPLR